ncbi:MAG: OmpP1/FadL family transporter [Planctomycetota bacterium]
MRKLLFWSLCAAAVWGGLCTGRDANAQSFGVELHNTLMPASGAMAGVSIAQPQDLVSGINANPATLTQFAGTQFQFGGAWAEPTFDLTQSSVIPAIGPPLIEPFSAKSNAPGTPVGNIGVTQNLNELGLPVTFGIGFVTTAGGFVDFRHVPESHGTSSALSIFSMPVSLGVQLTDRLSVGASTAMGIALYNAPFTVISSVTPDYALRATLGTNYQLTETTNVGAYYQSTQGFQFNDAVLLPTPGSGQTTLDVKLDLPQNIGFGVSNSALMNGNLLLAMDVLYKLWNEAESFETVYDNQWVVQFGTQYSAGRWRWRAGYAWAQNPLDPTPGNAIGGVIQPGELAAIRYTQGLLAIANQHRLSGGVGVMDVLPGVNLDLMAGGMFSDTQQLGDSTTTTVTSYWIGLGLTWQFGAGACRSN